MIKIAVLSDTHGMRTPLFVIEPVLKTADLIIHLGDGANDAKSISPNSKYICVGGNCDYDKQLKDFEVLSVAGKNILITHGHKQDVKSGLDNLAQFAMQNNCSIALFGHTHQVCDTTQNGIRLLNCGSLCYPRGGNNSYMIMLVDETHFIVKTMYPIL